MSQPPEFSRPIPIDAIGAGAASHSVEASAEECAALAGRFELMAMDGLSAEAEVRRNDTVVYARGLARAEVTQSCVVTGDPVSSRIEAEFDLRFLPETAPPSEEEIELSADECETMTYTGGAIDIGEAAAQTVALALDPFPRSGNAEQVLRDAGVISEEEAGPFGALKGLRDALAGKSAD
ncbi:YceD family protein [Parasphingopyxis lamellibrachiae]|uniref:Uncharacterized protein DUF177 involved in 23S rRNA accumulation n=1 Tax=Parasphingopyxis lamellibrachiae TaxID=680125 RepID=A0A3D9FHM6_9SPHN|nr:DUF177 domain-containing protein [Parasphingopyxis lamellibrachiae]RED17158.1 uncharacterized protein DUF177 involved in 23S rRNA accumulation [Parasphingopyxis lamellibrachiae]